MDATTLKSVFDEDALNIYIDGSSFNRPRQGGIGVRFVTVDAQGHEVIDDLALLGYKSATNNQMELQACIVALREASRDRRYDGWKRIVVHSDSKYLTEKSLQSARRSRQDGKGLGSEHPEQALRASEVRRKITKDSVDMHSVEMLGQDLQVRVISAEWMKVQRLHRYKYEVLSADSAFAGKVDVIFSDQYLGAGHHYLVRVNDDQKYPKIVEVIEELARGT